MQIHTAQAEVRSVFMGGAVGQAVSGVIWLLSTAAAMWISIQYGILVLAVGGAFIFPLTQLMLKLGGRKASLSPENPFNQLAMQIAFIVPLCLPLIGATALYNVNWFYPAFMLVIGVHYMPFIFLYGMWQYAILAAILIGGSIAIGMVQPDSFSLGGWFTGVVLLLFALTIGMTRSKAGFS
ncbi:MAG: hypothetical protein KF893_17175 [Caldilineaceae bacterium]|nr:hypothetical protein [Caldilineaceae bacterium]